MHDKYSIINDDNICLKISINTFIIIIIFINNIYNNDKNFNKYYVLIKYIFVILKCL